MQTEDGEITPVDGNETPAATANPLEPGGVRFEQVYGKMKDFEQQAAQYKDLGDVNELRQMRTEHTAWKKALDEYKAQQNLSEGDRTEAQRVASIRKELIKVYPDLEKVGTVTELMQQVQELRNSISEQSATASLARASETFAGVLKASKIDLKHQSKIEEYIASQMNDEQKKEFVKGDFSIAETIFNNELKDGLFASLKQKAILPTPNVRNTAGGTPPAGKAGAPKTLKEAEDASWARLSNRE